MSELKNGLRRAFGVSAERPTVPMSDIVTVSASASAAALPLGDTSETAARKLSAVDRCIEILSDSISKLPNYIMDKSTRKRLVVPELDWVLNIRPNEAMTPAVRKKLLETCRLEGGNGYDWIIRDPRTGRIKELIPVPWRLVTPWRDTSGHVWYTVTHPVSGEPMVLPDTDICHYKGASRDGLLGVSVLRRASEVVAAARAAQTYERGYYESGGQPAGVLQTDTDLGGFALDPDGKPIKRTDGSLLTRKDVLRTEWERIHSGPKNAHRIAILDHGLDYKPLAASNRDAQFVESKDISVKDISRFFGVPLYKLNEGKQAYGSNEQNAIEYVVSTLHPIVTQYEEEQTYKLLTDSQLTQGIEIRINMMAELKGDTGSRGGWYRTMREIGGFSVNDICRLEDMPDVEGGDDRQASLNFVPLADWKRLSTERNKNNGG